MWIASARICFIAMIITALLSMYLFYKKGVCRLIRDYHRYHRRLLQAKQEDTEKPRKTEESALRYMEIKKEASAHTEILSEKTQLLKEDENEMETAVIHD